MAFRNNKKKQQDIEPETPVSLPKAVTEHKKQQTPYGGSIDGVPVETAPHLIVSGPTGRGKSLRVLVPGALLWEGPRVLVSSKADFMQEVISRGIHHRGRVYIMDLTGEIPDDPDWLKDIEYTRVISDPCSLVDNDDDALEMASLLIKVGELSASGGGGGGGDNSAFWETQARKLLAGLILAGRASGKGIDWALQAAGQHSSDDENDPAWDTAYGLLHDKDNKPTSRHAREVRLKGQVDAKMRDGLKATMANAFSPWDSTTVSGYGRDDVVPFAPEMLEGDDEPTLAIISSMDGPGVGAAVAAVETIIRHWRRNLPRGLKRVLLSIDEFANTCFAAETEVLTADGIRQLGDLAGSTVTIRDGNGNWVDARASAYGVQELRKLTLSRGSEAKVLHATGEHGWIVVGHESARTTTDQLVPGDRLASDDTGSQWVVASVEASERTETVYCLDVPTTHSFVLEGGIVTWNCPLPKASTYLGESRGIGIAMVLALQSTGAQLREKYGEARAASIQELAPAMLILQGDAGSKEMLENAAWWDGEDERLVESIDHQGHTTTSAERVQRTTAQSLLPEDLDHGRLLLYGQKGHMVELPGIWSFEF